MLSCPSVSNTNRDDYDSIEPIWELENSEIIYLMANSLISFIAVLSTRFNWEGSLPVHQVSKQLCVFSHSSCNDRCRNNCEKKLEGEFQLTSQPEKVFFATFEPTANEP